jgi:hypothetical protein
VCACKTCEIVPREILGCKGGDVGRESGLVVLKMASCPWDYTVS